MINFSDIPTGDTKEDIKARKKIISDFFNDWCKANPSKRVFNSDLKDYINIKQVSFKEAIGHFSSKYLSTLALLQIDVVLRSAVRVGKPVPIKPNDKNQKNFIKMQIIKCNLVGIGGVKLTVGIRKSNEKIQYCITAIRT